MGKKVSIFLEKFRRMTSSGDYMPEIDGLRFIAVFWVAAWMHTANFINEKFYYGILFSPYVNAVVIEGGYGVSLFFIISGFILAMPFARQQFQNGKKVSLKEYYLRRITRLEPPYIAALLIAFFSLVLIVKKFSFDVLLPHLGASFIYSHQFIYGSRPWVLGVAWSLEVEVQFYILAPLLFFIYRIRQIHYRYFIFITLIAILTVYAFSQFWSGIGAIHNSLHCFLIGMFICDLYLNKIRLKGHDNFWFILAMLLFLIIPFLISIYDLWPYLLKHFLLGLSFYIGVTNKKMKRLLSIRPISIIGGMCYSIYLLHVMVMTAAFPFLKKIHVGNHWVAFVVYFLVIMILILIVAMLFYKLIEQPCMHKNWYKRILKKDKYMYRG